MPRAQTATEYLVLIAAVIIIALVVVAVLGGFPGMGRKAAESAAKTQLSSEKLGIENYAVTGGIVHLQIRNRMKDSVQIESIEIAEHECSIGTNNMTLRSGESRMLKVFCDHLHHYPNEPYDYSVAITYYEGRYGAKFRQEPEASLIGKSAASADFLYNPQLHVSLHNTCSTTVEHDLWCWGGNALGQLGDGTLTDRLIPERVATEVLDLSLDYGATCFLSEEGELYLAGYAPLDGTGYPEVVSNNFQMIGTFLDPVRVACADIKFCVLLDTGAIQCGYQYIDAPVSSVTSLPDTVEKVVAGRLHFCALLQNSSVLCWGENGMAQLGDGTAVNRINTAAPVRNLLDVVDLDSMYYSNCAVVASGEVYCWGTNDDGQLGDGTKIQRNIPVKVLSLENAVKVSMGSGFACAAIADGRVKCWGRNAEGQLGDGTQIERLTPVYVSGLEGAVKVEVGGTHACALINTGQIVCWGTNVYGMVGDGSRTRTLIPKLVYTPCDSDEDCASGTCKDSGMCSTGAIGDSCAWGEDCDSGYCNAYYKVCHDGALGTECVMDDDCATGYCGGSQCTNGQLGDGCTFGSNCASGYCNGGACGQGLIGELCDEAEDCTTLHCDSIFTTSCTDGSLFSGCMFQSDCEPGLECISNTMGDYRYGGVGQMCSDGEIGSPCSTGADCESGYCESSGPSMCTTGEIGQPCGGSADCQSGFCSGMSMTCSDGATGSPCFDGSECQSGVCDEGSCT